MAKTPSPPVPPEPDSPEPKGKPMLTGFQRTQENPVEKLKQNISSSPVYHEPKDDVEISDLVDSIKAHGDIKGSYYLSMGDNGTPWVATLCVMTGNKDENNNPENEQYPIFVKGNKLYIGAALDDPMMRDWNEVQKKMGNISSGPYDNVEHMLKSAKNLGMIELDQGIKYSPPDRSKFKLD